MLTAGDPDRASSAVRELFRRANPVIRMHILSTLGDYGIRGATAARDLLRDESQLGYHRHVIPSLVKAGGAAAMPELVSLLERELPMWRNGREPFDPQSHYRRTYTALLSLRTIDDPQLAARVMSFCAAWCALPETRHAGRRQIARECAQHH
jgi:hypothetical protein